MNLNNSTVDELVTGSRAALTNALNESSLAPLANYGYNKEKLKEGTQLVDLLEELHLRKRNEYDTKELATHKKYQEWERANEVYVDLLDLSRVVFKNDLQERVELDLDGKRAQALPGWIAQANKFYTNAMKSKVILKKLGKYNITSETFQKGLDMLDPLEDAYAKQDSDKGIAQNATLERDAAKEELVKYMSEFQDFATIALKKNPQLLEQIGIVVKR